MGRKKIAIEKIQDSRLRIVSYDNKNTLNSFQNTHNTLRLNLKVL